MRIVGIANCVRIFVFSAKYLLFFSVVEFCTSKTLYMRWWELREEDDIRLCDIDLDIHFSSMIDPVFEDEETWIIGAYKSPKSNKKYTNPRKHIFPTTSNLQNRKCEAPFTVIIPLRCPDIATGATKNFYDDVTCGRFSEGPCYSDDKWCMSEDAETGQEAKNFLDQFFHKGIIKKHWRWTTDIKIS